MIKSFNGSWFISFKRKPNAKIRLYCFPFAGGGASVFRSWSESLPDFVEVISVQLPGRENRFNEPLRDNLDEVIKELKENFEEFNDRPYMFFGHSVGGLIGHQLLVMLENSGSLKPKHLVVSGCSAPTDTTEYYEKIAHLNDREFMEKLPQYGGTPPEMLKESELMELYVPILKSDLLLSENYRVQSKKLSCPITAFAGVEDKVDLSKLKLWKLETKRELSLVEFPGDHFFIKQNRSMVLERLSEIILNLDDSKIASRV